MSITTLGCEFVGVVGWNSVGAVSGMADDGGLHFAEKVPSLQGAPEPVAVEDRFVYEFQTVEPDRVRHVLELARRLADVGAVLDQYGEVTVLRGAQALRLGLPDSPEVVQVFRDLCRLLASLANSDEPGHVTFILEMAWPWTRALLPQDQLELVGDVGRVAEMSESLEIDEVLLAEHPEA